MPNERLRDALLRNGLNTDQVAKATKVDPKTVERWINKGRIPYPRHRLTIAAMVRETENYLWPDAIAPERKVEISGSEIVKIYPHRHSVPTELWARLLDQAAEHIEVLVYSGLFLTDDPNIDQAPTPQSRKRCQGPHPAQRPSQPGSHPPQHGGRHRQDHPREQGTKCSGVLPPARHCGRCRDSLPHNNVV